MSNPGEYSRRSTIVFLILITFSLISMIFNLQSVKGVFVEVTDIIKYPFFTVINATYEFLADSVSTFSHLDELAENLVEKELQLKKLQEDAGTIEIYENRINILEQQLDIKTRLDMEKSEDWGEIISARIISYGSSSYFESLYINKGRRHGLDIGMPVIAYQITSGKGVTAVVGKIADISQFYSIVIPLYHPSFRVGAMGLFSGERCVVEGLGKSSHKAVLKYIDDEANIEVGEWIITYGENSIFPKDIRIGEIEEIEENRMNRSKIATIKPYIDFSTLEYVFVIKRPMPDDLRELIDNQEANQ